ncbi:hypothetical protein [Streptomyces sp. NPDC001594]|uniref:hypothetical protein n=1 Tax=Streptomyces sp. NPDC001594 TaxID=3364590 RepID=UPI00367E3C55
MTPKNTTTAAALVGGYLLGRTKKAKMAIGVGMFLAGRRLDLDPRRIGKLLAASPVTGALSEQIRRELFEATKSAAAQALTRRAAGLADSLQQRTQALGRDDAPDAPEADADDGPEPRKPTRSTAATKTAGKKTTGRAPSSSGGSGRGAGKPTAARKRTSAPRKSTASSTRKSSKGRGDSDE